MTEIAREYPIVRTVMRMIPELAQARLRAMRDGPDKRQAVEWVVLGMALDPAKAVVNFETMSITVKLE